MLIIRKQPKSASVNVFIIFIIHYDNADIFLPSNFDVEFKLKGIFWYSLDVFEAKIGILYSDLSIYKLHLVLKVGIYRSFAFAKVHQ